MLGKPNSAQPVLGIVGSAVPSTLITCYVHRCSVLYVSVSLQE